MDLFIKDRVEFILKDRDGESALIKKRVYLVGLIILVLVIILLARIFFLTVIQNTHYTTFKNQSPKNITDSTN